MRACRFVTGVRLRSAVRGNNDKGAWASALPTTEVVDAGSGVLVYVIHNVAELDLDPAAGGFRVVVAGHSHHPSSAESDGVLWFNPGSTGPRRFRRQTRPPSITGR